MRLASSVLPEPTTPAPTTAAPVETAAPTPEPTQEATPEPTPVAREWPEGVVNILTVKLRPGQEWSDGSAMTALDLNRVATDAACGYAGGQAKLYNGAAWVLPAVRHAHRGPDAR